MKCLIENLEVNYPCSMACPLYGDCVMAFLEARKQQVRTNADRIRAMSDEELARQLVINVDGLSECRIHLSAPTGKMFVLEAEAERVTLDWLRQPAEED